MILLLSLIAANMNTKLTFYDILTSKNINISKKSETELINKIIKLSKSDLDDIPEFYGYEISPEMSVSKEKLKMLIKVLENRFVYKKSGTVLFKKRLAVIYSFKDDIDLTIFHKVVDEVFKDFLDAYN